MRRGSGQRTRGRWLRTGIRATTRSWMRLVTDDSDLQHAHLRIHAVHRRVEHLETHLRRLHEHVGLGRLPQHRLPSITPRTS